MQKLAPIVLFVYNRPWHTKKTIEALKKNNLASQSILYIFSDGPKSDDDEITVNEVRDYIKNINGFYDIIIKQRKENYGLANSVIDGVSEILNNDDKVIVLEDDIETAPKFLQFMNDALSFYENDNSIYTISGYTYPVNIPQNYELDVFISRRSSSWGWATWKNRWCNSRWDRDAFKPIVSDKNIQKEFNLAGEDLTPMLIKQLNNKIDSWAIRYAYTHYVNKAYGLFPLKSLAVNIGTDGSGTHIKRRTSRYNVMMDTTDKRIFLSKDVILNEQIEEQIRKIVRPSIVARIKIKLSSLFGMN